METDAGDSRVVSLRFRRSDHDVTNTVQVSSWRAVSEAVHDIFVGLYPNGPWNPLRKAFRDFDDLFRGRVPGYLGCDTVYHDIQHTLDMTLAMARLIKGYELTHARRDQLGPGRAMIGIITSLLHDSGYIRHAADEGHLNGAEFTRSHVTRSALFLDRYMVENGLGAVAPVARQIVHFTGYEVDFSQIRIENRKDRALGHLLGTADLMAQMADRCYLEKCRDRLFPEFVLGGIAMYLDEQGRLVTRYRSGLDLLRNTLDFYETQCTRRLDDDFGGVHRCMKAVYDGRNPYMVSLDKNIFYLKRVLRGERWPLLRRHPPCVLANGETVERVRCLVAERLRQLRGQAA
ncbi:MAG: hypothetical protein PVG91_06975 [Gammaproteobacteria bacterium]|jgi:hypothetical protein